MGCAPMAHVLWSKIMNYNPANPKWVSDDGHACVPHRPDGTVAVVARLPLATARRCGPRALASPSSMNLPWLRPMLWDAAAVLAHEARGR